MKWIKASQRLPKGHATEYCWRLFESKRKIGPSISIYDNTLLLEYGNVKTRYGFDEIEWLDESIPASLEDEAKALYPYPNESEYEKQTLLVKKSTINIQRSAHITCAGMYTDTIDKLKNDVAKLQAENKALIEEIQNWKDELKDQAREHRNNR